MRITCIGPIKPYRGGISQFNTLLIKALSKNNKVEIISWKRRFPHFLYPTKQIEKQDIKKIKSDKRFVLDSLNPITWFKAVSIIRKKDPDLVIFHWVTPILSPIFTIISFLVKRLTKTKILFVCHNVVPHEKRFLDKLLTKITFSNVDFFIAHSKEDTLNLKNIKKNANCKLGFMPLFNIFSLKKFNQANFKKKLGLNKNTALFFGYIREYKGLKYLIKAMPLVIKKINLDLLIVGEFWKNKKEHLDLIKELKLEKNIKLVDKYVPDNEVGKYFAVSDVAVLPYITATQSAVVQVAYSFDKPAITTNVGGLAESVIDNKTGFIVKPKDSKKLADAIITFYRKNKKQAFIKEVKKIKTRFSWKNYANIIESFLK